MRCHIHKYVDAVDIKASSKKRGREEYQREEFSISISTGAFKHANSEHTDTGTSGQTDREEIQEALHNAAMKQKKDKDQAVRTVVSSFSNDQT